MGRTGIVMWWAPAALPGRQHGRTRRWAGAEVGGRGGGRARDRFTEVTLFRAFLYHFFSLILVCCRPITTASAPSGCLQINKRMPLTDSRTWLTASLLYFHVFIQST